MAKYQPNVCVDFDGVIHSYASGWCGEENIPDKPVDGSREWIQSLLDAGYKVTILSSRAQTNEGVWAISRWLYDHGFPNEKIEITAVKTAALVYIDDRGWHFTGNNFPTPEEIKNFKPWNKK